MTPDDKLVMLYVPCGCEEEASRLITSLLQERLVACGNILPSRSFYINEGETVNEMELILVCKTTFGRAQQAQARIAEMHSYEIPCIITLETLSVNSAYANWVLRQVSGDAIFMKRDTVGGQSEVFN